jgi:hypothetical protein
MAGASAGAGAGGGAVEQPAVTIAATKRSVEFLMFLTADEYITKRYALTGCKNRKSASSCSRGWPAA